MKKYLSILVGLIMILGVVPVYAANEVTVGPETQILVSDYTLVVSGVDRTIDSLTVTDSNFTVSLAPGANFSVVSNDKRKFSYTVGTGVTVGLRCTGDSYVSFAASSDNAAAVSVIVTPSTTETCDGTTTTATTVTGSTSGGGGSGGGNNPNANIFAQTQTTVQAQVSPVTETITTTTVVPSATSVSTYKFTKALVYGSESVGVTELQERLTSEGVYSGPVTGYFGPLTLAAVKKYQEKEGIATSGQAGYGNVGPLTRAELNTSAQVSASASVSAPVSVSVSAPTSQSGILQSISQFRLQIRVFEDAQTLIPSSNTQGIANVEVHIEGLRNQLLQTINQYLGQ
ncbi:peptidoglycan-binding protein [Patescibacteria group bacterium]|nr:peptidoglycan-binding protein [Patescibacteria group bacterium]